MKSDLFKLNLKDVSRALVSTVLAAVLAALLSSLYQLVNTAGFDVFTADWHFILSSSMNLAINAGFGAFIGYIGKNFLSDDSGKFLGAI